MPCIKSHLALIPLLLLSKSDPLHWAPILFFKFVMNTRTKKEGIPFGMPSFFICVPVRTSGLLHF